MHVLDTAIRAIAVGGHFGARALAPKEIFCNIGDGVEHSIDQVWIAQHGDDHQA